MPNEVPKPQLVDFDASSLRSVLAYNMRLLRHERKISQEELAHQCKLDRTFISAVERRRRNVSLDNLEKIAQALDVDIRKLFTPLGEHQE